MKLIVSSLAIALATSAVSAAPPPPVEPAPAAVQQSPKDQRPSEERLALARRFLALAMPEDRTLQDMRDFSQQVVAAAAIEEDESASDQDWTKKYIDRVLVKAAPIIRDHMLSIREATAFVYAREFSPAELQDMIAFAQTPAGEHYWAREHFIDLDPSIVAQGRLMREAMAPVYLEVRKELCQEATAKRIAAGDKKAKCPLSEPETAAG